MGQIRLKSRDDIEKIKESAKVLALTMLELEKHIHIGITTKKLDSIASDFILRNKAKPAFKGYNGFKGTICTSVNEEVIHGIPSSRKLKNGDIISIDCGVILNGFYSDMAKTFPVGDVSDEVKLLLQTTKESLYKGIEVAKVGNRILDISKSIENHISPFGYGIVKDYTGHGVGYALHEEPSIPNYHLYSMKNLIIKEGMVLAIEPMINLKGSKVSVKNDGWTVVTSDLSYSAHFEHTVAIVNGDPLILTEL